MAIGIALIGADDVAQGGAQFTLSSLGRRLKLPLADYHGLLTILVQNYYQPSRHVRI